MNIISRFIKWFIPQLYYNIEGIWARRSGIVRSRNPYFKDSNGMDEDKEALAIWWDEGWAEADKKSQKGA